METVNTATTVETGEGTKTPVQTMAATQQPFIVGEHSVYPDVPSLFEGAKAKEAFIKTLQAEKRESEALIKELQEKLKAVSNLNQFKEDIENMDEEQVKNNEQTSSMTPEQVQELALKALQQQREQDTKTANYNSVMEVVNKVFGESAGNKLDSKCAELGISKEAGEELAKNSPKAFLKMLGLDEPKQVTMDSLINKGRTMSAEATPQGQATDALTGLLTNPANCHNVGYLQKLFDDVKKDPSVVLDNYKPWTV